MNSVMKGLLVLALLVGHAEARELAAAEESLKPAEVLGVEPLPMGDMAAIVLKVGEETLPVFTGIYEGAATLLAHARELADAGAAMLVLELVPATLAARVSVENPQLLTIGIGAGTACAGQVLVLHDMLGITRGKLPRFVRNFLEGASSVEEAIRRYVAAVKDGSFPDESLHGY